MPATATAPARVQALPGRPPRRGHAGLPGLARMGTLVLVLALLVLTMASPLDRAGRGAHAATHLSASESAAHTHATLASLTQVPAALLRAQTHPSDIRSTTPGAAATGGQITSATGAAPAHAVVSAPASTFQDAPASPTVGHGAPSGHSGDHHHHVDLDPMSTSALPSGRATAFAPAPVQLLSLLLVAAVTLTYPD